ncbi:MAG TPA: 50S ribosomal protein L35 [Actinomycetota bacterium]|nr:50S ribosomal protein L35 [Actinomycetota bacterium]
MPKMKTHRSTAKRVKRTGTGKLVRKRANRSHILEKKSSKRKRALGQKALVSDADAPRLNRLLGG